MDTYVKIELAKVDADKDARSQARYTVIFECQSGSHRFSIPIAVGDVEEVDLVRVARARLHQVLQALASYSEGWEIAEEQMQKMVRR